MTGKLKYIFFFFLVTIAAYTGSALFLSYLDRELLKDLPLIAPAKSSEGIKEGPPLSPTAPLKTLAKRSVPTERKEDVSKGSSWIQEKHGKTSLNLKLLGAAVNEKGSSWAIIQDLDRDRQDMVKVGSVVAGAKVVSIAKDRVVLSFNGREETLLLGDEAARSPSTQGEGGTKESAPSTYVVDRETVRENLDNLPSLLTQARAELYFKEGRPEGFQLSQIQRQSIIKSVGFQDGDVIRSVNGKEVRSLEDAIALYQQFGDSDSYTIGILRDEKPKTLHVKIK